MKPCPQCGAIDRFPSGGCRPCQKANRKILSQRKKKKQTVCPKCKATDWLWNGQCRPCRRQKSKEWRDTPEGKESAKKSHTKWKEKNPEEYRKVKERKTAKIAKLRKWAQGFKTECKDCGAKPPPERLHFDHLPGTKKEANIARMVAHGKPKETILEEMEKCEVVCARCHMKRSMDRGQITPGRGPTP